MGKHSKNNNERPFFTHAERRAANYGRMSSGFLGGHNTADGNFKEYGWGTETRFLDADAMKDLDACSLSLQPCVDPVVTPSGVLYDKRVVVTLLLETSTASMPRSPAPPLPPLPRPLPTLGSRPTVAARVHHLAQEGHRAGDGCVGSPAID